MDTDQLKAARKAAKGAPRLDPIEKAKRNPKSLRAAITAKCWDCIGADADPNPKWRIGNCEITDCPLFHARPWQSLCGSPVPSSLK